MRELVGLHRRAADLLQIAARGALEVRPIQHAVGGRQAMRPAFSVLSMAKLETAGHRMRSWEEALTDWVGRVKKEKAG